ncbi:MAG: tetratricopeptide repeat protein [Candidatus Hydrogenedentes bacterium]|nr:tetratricopeptide repeat protein [Candidatus Hydrogenedentota bacterium]
MKKKNRNITKKIKQLLPAPPPLPTATYEYRGMAVIAALCFIVFGYNITFSHFQFDVPQMIFENPHINTGLSWENIQWVFTTPNLALYQPLPDLTFMLESQFFGNWSGGYNTMTLLWHIACMCLFLRVMTRLTHNFTVIFAATLLLAVHPVQTLIVSQMAPRNEIMQAFFMLLSIDAYRRYVEKGSYPAYAFSLVCMAVGLLCKQVIVILPVALLLLDYWPFKRIDLSFQDFRQTLRTAGKLILEKMPWFSVSLLGIFLAFYGKTQYDQINYHVSRLSLSDSIYAVITGYARYLGHLLYPVRVSYFETYGQIHYLWFFLLSAAVLLTITIGVFIGRKKYPYLIIGWCWFIAFLFPVSGVVPYMIEAISLRYLYIPAMGLAIAVSMGWYTISRPRKTEGETEKLSKTGQEIMPSRYWVSIAIVTALLSVLAFWQNTFLRDTESIVQRMQELADGKNTMGHNALAIVRMKQKRYEEAEEHYRRCVELQPKTYIYRLYYGRLLNQAKKYQEQMDILAPAVEAFPDDPAYLELYGVGLLETGRVRQAEVCFRHGLRCVPDAPAMMQNLAYSLILQGKYSEAISFLENVLQVEPNNPTAQKMKQVAEKALAQYNR